MWGKKKKQLPKIYKETLKTHQSENKQPNEKKVGQRP